MVKQKRPHPLAGRRCECCDPGCPVEHGGNDCSRPARSLLRRVDLEDQSGVACCAPCAQDALGSGLFYEVMGR